MSVRRVKRTWMKRSKDFPETFVGLGSLTAVVGTDIGSG